MRFRVTHGMSIAMLLLTSLFAQSQRPTPSKKAQPVGRPMGTQGETEEQQKGDQKPVFENDKVRVFRYELPAGGTFTTPEHQSERILVPTGDMTVMNGSQRIKARTGEVQILKSGSGEKLINNATTPIVVVDVELLKHFDPGSALCGLNGSHCESVLGGDLKTGSWGINNLMKSVTLEIANMEIDPGVTTDEMSRRAPYLRVAIGPLKLAEQVGDATPTVIEQAPGDVTWVPVGEPLSLKNMGVVKASFAMVRFPSM